ncbi:hypothetical protein PPSIR1_13038 [Plesiocystis pacifica SIR-1]|uniref:Lipoprotein n=2 Tax=Plesiocystis pacifica TaxID=191768 RepID=A6G0B2_9BACT|nr:hypothetical protein PPSIR1_13038 [Plesiocystis pacifica SIR-1]
MLAPMLLPRSLTLVLTSLALSVSLSACKDKGEAGEDTDAKAEGGDAKAAEGGEAKAGEGGEAKAAEAGGADTAANAAGADGGGAPAVAEEREDLSCDPAEKGACLEGETCVGGQGCEAVWECDAKIDCKKGVREYCGCDGRTFEAVYGNCPAQKYQYPGPCK